MNRPCNHLLADASFTEDENRGVGLRHLRDIPQSPQHRLALTNDLIKTAQGLDLLLQILRLDCEESDFFLRLKQVIYVSEDQSIESPPPHLEPGHRRFRGKS